jgi:hypothetical protein
MKKKIILVTEIILKISKINTSLLTKTILKKLSPTLTILTPEHQATLKTCKILNLTSKIKIPTLFPTTKYPRTTQNRLKVKTTYKIKIQKSIKDTRLNKKKHLFMNLINLTTLYQITQPKTILPPPPIPIL